MTTRRTPQRVLKVQPIWLAMLAVLGVAVGVASMFEGFWAGWKTPRDLLDNVKLYGGPVLVVWSLMGARRPTPLRFIPPAVVVYPVFMLWMVNFIRATI